MQHRSAAPRLRLAPELADPTDPGRRHRDLASPTAPSISSLPSVGRDDSVARLALIEIQHRSAAPVFAPPPAPRLAGLLTIELTSPAPRLCPAGQPYIGPTATLPGARGKGVGHALVDAALTWAHVHDYQWISVDFETASPLSRPFWLKAGFCPVGYGVLRLIDSGAAGQPG